MILRSDRLRVEIAEPGVKPNDTFRFDRSAYITEVILDNTMHFCASEPRNLSHPCSGGRGLCSEFMLDLSKEAAADGCYPKFGVGLLPRVEGEEYIFYKRYAGAELFPVQCENTESQARFVMEAIPCMGYALRCIREVSVNGCTITMTTRLENTGTKVVQLKEYCHNFLSIDGMALSDQYALDLPAIRDQSERHMIGRAKEDIPVAGTEHGYRFTAASAKDLAFWVDLEGADAALPFEWTLSHSGARAGVRVREHFSPDSIQVWAVDHMICPEVFIDIYLAPGENREWKREWTFFAEA